MRIDEKLTALPLTDAQRFFAACWYNMVHAFSLDSYRVRAMNPNNGLRELQRMLAPPANGDDLATVAEELKRILQADPVLKLEPFARTTVELLDLLNVGKPNDPKSYDKTNKPLLQAFSTELLSLLRDHYVKTVLSELEGALINTTAQDAPESGWNCHIQTLTGNLLSTLLDEGASLESLYQLYRQVIAGAKSGKEYRFDKKLGLLYKLINEIPHKFSVVFTVDNVSDISHFPKQIGTVSFLASPPEVVSPKPQVARYLLPRSRRLFAQVEVETKDFRAAGSEAYTTINNVLDLVRFEYERERLHLPDEFVITSASQDQKTYRIFPIPKVVPNPANAVDMDSLEGFIDSVNELMMNPGFQGDGGSRVQSAFRLYRIGADTHIFENKLINWWTAIEYLVKGNNTAGKIGDAVENALVPVLCLGYVEKLLMSFRVALVDTKAQLTDPTSGEPLQLKDLSADQLYRIFKDPLQREKLIKEATDPFLKQKLTDFLAAISDAQSTAKLLKDHDQRLRWHVKRLYRARCDIVHSAERIVNAALLCANLEFYLKSTLTALLQSLRIVPHLSGPKEFFDRQTYAYEKLLKDLDANDDRRLLALLSR